MLADLAERIINNKDDWFCPFPRGKMPYNATTDHQYHGVNILSLAFQSMSMGYTSDGWATYRQWKSIGAQVRKGEKGTLIVRKGQWMRKEGDDAIPTSYFKTWNVFNAEQVDGYDVPQDPVFTYPMEERHNRANATISATGAIVRDGARCAYFPKSNQIHMVPRKMFTAHDAYWHTLFHELVHWSGYNMKPPRIKKEDEIWKKDKSIQYAVEEITAEIGASILACQHGIILDKNTSDHPYIAGWLSSIPKSDRPAALMTGAADAWKASEFINGFSQSAEDQQAA